eukprot:CAMPEP_0184338610 /NCGR_PEP_ID=MMETSP1089-20130417/7182_1 /TAXON_ID=38269 ORGANISM="Gloeochaete wittrockiana, Strain SAG46.84" /NCGR_SAMPLE_ID=MMETSP1089 /ASSEMBLY_ACC=CAM_ASM_000445 /LENGTH=126 /DNA_ID=CAMNT_0026665251 /DNA_START=23 /DNA_END=403 /DNA_ORIENTATION=-
MADKIPQMRQDMPPQGGFPKPNMIRDLPKRGPSGSVLLLGAIGITLYGLFALNKKNLNDRQLEYERQDMRLSIIPFLQAESDLLFVLQNEKSLERQAMVLDGSEIKACNNFYKTRWMPGMQSQTQF